MGLLESGQSYLEANVWAGVVLCDLEQELNVPSSLVLVRRSTVGPTRSNGGSGQSPRDDARRESANIIVVSVQYMLIEQVALMGRLVVG